MRGDGAVEDVGGDCPPQDGRVVGDDDDDDFVGERSILKKLPTHTQDPSR